MRVVHLSHDMEAIGRLFSPEHAIEAARDRRDRTYDPALADLFVEHGRDWLDQLGEIEPWDAVLALEPEPHRMLSGEELDDALTVAADFIDLKSPYMGGHSRRCAELAADAARVLGLAEEAVTAVRRAALVHDFGTTVVPNSIWDKPGPLTRTEFDRVELHPMLTEQMLRRSPALAVLNPVASAHHEKCDGSGYHKRVQADADDLGACVLAATEIYVGLTTERADRPPFSPAGRGRRASPARIAGRARASREPCGARGRGARRAARRRRASGRRIRAGSPGARSTCCGSRPGDSRRARSPIGSTSLPRPPITTSSTSTARSARRRAPPPRCGRCSTPSSSEW